MSRLLAQLGGQPADAAHRVARVQHGAEVGAEVDRILPDGGKVEVVLVAVHLAVVRVRQGDGGEAFARARPLVVVMSPTNAPPALLRALFFETGPSANAGTARTTM